MERITPKSKRVELLLDSGAYSSWTRQEDGVDLNAYIDYIIANKKLLFSYVNLDQLPGVFGQQVTTSDIETSAKRGYDNLQIMKSHGLHPMPVFHMGEDLSWLMRMLRDGETYIGLSPRQDQHASRQEEWLDLMFTILTNEDGLPFIDTHGFGVTKVKFLLRYPFTTVDSTRWSIDAGFGHILVPKFNSGKPDWWAEPEIVATTEIESTANNRIQFKSFSITKRRQVEDYIENYLDLTPEKLRDESNARRKSYLIFYDRFARASQPIKFNHRRGSFELSKYDPLNMDPWPQRDGLKVFVATMAKDKTTLLNDMQIWPRLLSYYELKKLPPDTLATYVNNGILPAGKRITRRTNGKTPTVGKYFNVDVIEPERPPWETDDDQTSVSPK